MKLNPDRRLKLVLRLLRGEPVARVARRNGSQAALARDNEILEACLRLCYSPFALPGLPR